MPKLEQEGVFRGSISNYGIDEADSGAVAIVIHVDVEEIFAEGEWHDWREHQFTTEGRVWVVKKDGTVNQRQAEALIQCAGWDGLFESISSRSWTPTPISVTVKADTYNDETRYRIEWVNPHDSSPGGGGNVDPAKAKALDSKLGAQFRALVGNQKRNGAVPAVKPKAKPKAKTALGADVEREVPF